MSKKIKKTRTPKSRMQAKPVHDDGIGPFRVTVTVFGCYTHGNLAGKTNPKAFARMTLHGDTFKQAIGKIAMTGAFYRIEEVIDEGKEAIRFHQQWNDTSITESSGNVFHDLGIDDPGLPGPSAYLHGPHDDDYDKHHAAGDDMRDESERIDLLGLVDLIGEAMTPIVNAAVKKRAVRKAKKTFELSEPLVTEGEL